MYNKSFGLLNTATGISLLPNTGNSRALFVLAASLIAGGIVVFIVSTLLSRKSSAAN